MEDVYALIKSEAVESANIESSDLMIFMKIWSP